MRSTSASDSNNTTVNYYTNSSYGFTARDCEAVKAFSFDNLLLSLRMSSQNLYIVKPSVAREIFISDNARYLSQYFHLAMIHLLVVIIFQLLNTWPHKYGRPS